MEVKIYNQDAREVGSVELKAEVFGVEPNEAVVHQYIVNYLARQRQGNANTRTRRDVRGGGKKPYRQKGTGRARRGTDRSPVIRGGGTVFGPHSRSYGSKMPKAMKRIALKSIFSDKARSERIKVIDAIKFSEIKTKEMISLLGRFDLDGKKCLVLDEGVNEPLQLSCRNLQKVKYCRAALTNGYDLLDADYVVLTKAGLEKVHEVFA
jgi:large subunit ribosomal protein L4